VLVSTSLGWLVEDFWWQALRSTKTGILQGCEEAEKVVHPEDFQQKAGFTRRFWKLRATSRQLSVNGAKRNLALQVPRSKCEFVYF